MYYNPGVMERVLQFRLRSHHVTACPHCIGYVAMLRRGDDSTSLPLNGDAEPVPAANFRWLPASEPYYGDAALE